ncbi:MAG TPA: hypothetical protein VNT20_15890 [Flavisolibacter sp.]|nr:hypothetical protein [Flavisolibacter sp.]
MVKINILKCCHYTEAQWLKLLQSKKANAFHFMFPKQTRQTSHRKKTMLLQYYIAVCIGQELESIATRFFYNITTPGQSHNFHFIVITRKLRQLAHILFTISSGFSKYGLPAKAFVDYVLTLHALMNEMVACKDQRYACPELVMICKRLSPAGI